MTRSIRPLLALFALVVVCSAAPNVRADTINFDNLATGAVVTNQYQSQGVLFSGTPNATLISEANGNGVTLPNQLFNFNGGAITIRFVTPGTNTAAAASGVSFLVSDAESGVGSQFTAQAFNVNDVLLQTLTGTSNNEPILSFSVSGINRVVFTQSSDFEAIDNLIFTIGAGPSAVPEPATMTLLGAGLAGVAAGVRRRRRARHDG